MYTEKKIGDEWVAVWETSGLPEGARVSHVTLIPYRGEKAVVGRQDGKLRLPEGDVREGEDAEAAIRRIANEQAGILEPRITHLGHFTYTAGALNKRYEAGTRVYDALYALEVGELADSPGDESFERRIILQRELNEILRSTYVERRREYTDALDRWLVERIKANMKAGSGA
jgi:ADP-ribose pyrophosphatase YjhB (NUDIX family)